MSRNCLQRRPAISCRQFLSGVKSFQNVLLFQPSSLEEKNIASQHRFAKNKNPLRHGPCSPPRRIRTCTSGRLCNMFRWRSGQRCWRASGGVVVVRSRPHTHSGSTTRSPYSVQGVLLLTFLTVSRPAITQNKVPGWTSRLSTPSRSALPPARRKRWGSQFFFTIWITSSSWSTCPLPTRPGLCFTDEPQTHAYLKSVFRVRWILSQNISTVGSATPRRMTGAE